MSTALDELAARGLRHSSFAAQITEETVLRATQPLRGKPLELREPGRVCDGEDCTTILRRSNLGDTCAVCTLAAAPAGALTDKLEVPWGNARGERAEDRLIDAMPGKASELAERAGVRAKYAREILTRLYADGAVTRSGRAFPGYVYRRLDG